MSNKKQVSESNKLHKLMYELLYPAILGSALYSVVNHFALHLKHYDDDIYIRLSLGGLFTAFFCASALTEYDKKDYGYVSFIIDCVEVLLMYLCFYFLGFFPQDGDPYTVPKLLEAHLIIISLLFTQSMWRYTVNLDIFDLIELRLIFFYSLLISMRFGTETILITYIICFVAFSCIGLYVFRPEWYLNFRLKLVNSVFK